MKNCKQLFLLMLIVLVPVYCRAQNEAVAVAPQQLVLEIEVPAPLHEVWLAFSTSEGLSTWLFPNATVALRPGGDWLVHFPGGSTGGGTIVSFVPEKELVLKIQPGFTHTPEMEEFTRIFRGPSSLASTRVMTSTAPFVAE